MKRLSRPINIVMAEILIFAAMMAVIWLDEFMDIPYRLFGAPPTPYRLAEYIIETASCAMVGVVIIIGTIMILRHIDRLEKYLRVCAWCRKVISASHFDLSYFFLPDLCCATKFPNSWSIFTAIFCLHFGFWQCFP